jgi:uncharacterized protein YukE
MGASSDGYTVRSGMSGPAKELDGAGDDAGHIRAAVQPPLCYTQDALGGAEVSEAFNAFAAAWDADASTLGAALHELGDKIRLSKRAYSGSDHGVAAQAHAVSVGVNGATALPVSADRLSALSGY